jgi:transcriptional regulator with PAS, ATPase and Fis domain
MSVNDFGCCILYNPRDVLRHLPIIEVLAPFIGNMVCVDVATPQNKSQQTVNRASTEHQQSLNRASTQCQQSVNRVSTERQQSANYCGCWILYNPRAVQWLLSIIEELAACIGNLVNIDVATPENELQQSVNRSSTERQQCINTASTKCQHSVNDFGCCILCNPRAVMWHLDIVQVLATFMGNMVWVDIATPENELPQSINRATMILGIVSCTIQGLYYGI